MANAFDLSTARTRPLLLLAGLASCLAIAGCGSSSSSGGSSIVVGAENTKVEKDYVLDKNDPHIAVGIPAGFTLLGGNRSWRIFGSCAG